ncbi:MAG: peptidoglycan-associated lipoprotein Pal [Deltaproteobacteria bacterium]|nr:peptidoglycan-associated lipoprotein Pal [Deltaproteobacteria bacterium]
MKRYLTVIPILALSLSIIAGCGGKKLINEEMGQGSQSKPSESGPSETIVPDQNPMSEAVTSEDLLGEAKLGGKYASLSPGDDLTKEAMERGHLYTIYFDYDTYTIRDGDKSKLDKNAKWLNLNSSIAIRIEGHADERGETEYNLALAEKRARSVRKFLEDMGIKTDRLDSITYGEEKPADPGHDESAWSKNRRAEFVITRTN